MQCCGYSSRAETKLAALATFGLCLVKVSSLEVDIVMTKHYRSGLPKAYTIRSSKSTWLAE